MTLKASSGRAGQGRAGQGRAGLGRAGQGRAGQGRAGLAWAGQGKPLDIDISNTSSDNGADSQVSGPKISA